jgi:hypothetical protein
LCDFGSWGRTIRIRPPSGSELGGGVDPSSVPSDTSPPRIVGVPRSGGAIRWLTRLSAADEEAYVEAVARVLPVVEAGLGSAALANRAVVSGHELRVADWRPARRVWDGYVAAALGAPVVLVADVADCYAQLGSATVTRTLRDRGADGDDTVRIRRWLDRLGEHGVRGLPVGPAPSAVLANAALGTVDERLTDAGVRHVRWVDDFIVVAGSVRAAVGALDVLTSSLDRLGLRLHPGKTALLRDRDEIWLRLGYLPSTAGDHQRPAPPPDGLGVG